MNIGNKIKSLRTQKGITQAELAGNVITRNMLSQIESGKANPSLSTLIHISEALDVPIEYLVSEDENIFPYKKKNSIEKLRKEFSENHYHGCITVYEKELNETDDEIAFMISHSYIECAKKSLFNGNLDTAKEYVKKAITFCALTIYPTHDVEAVAALVGAISENVQSPKLEFDSEFFLKNVNDAVFHDMYSYIIEDKTHKFFNKTLYEHLRAKELMRSFYYQNALEIMYKIEENKSALNVDATVLFNIYRDMEYCCKELRDYEGAYKYSSKRIALLAAFKS